MFDLETKIIPYMSKYRYEHTLSVVNECKALARLFDVDADKLTIAAYLHDITKEMSIDEQINLCRKMGESLDFCSINSEKTLHAFSAPALIKKDFKEINDEIIFNAVRYHTTGRADMTIYEKLLYLADYIEPTRRFDDCKKLREYFYSGTIDENKLDQTIFLSLKITISDLLEKNAYIHLKTIEAYNAYSLKTGAAYGQ